MRARSLISPLAVLLLGFLAGRAFAPGYGGEPDRTAGDEQVRAGGGTDRSPAGMGAGAESPAVREASLRTLPTELTPEETRDIEVFRRASGAVVFIRTTVLERDFFSMNVYEISRGTGSGLVWDRSGHVVTNFHVIEGGNAFRVRLVDQTEYDAEVVGYAPEKDLAVLKIDAPPSKLAPLEIGRSRDLLVGMKVLAVGNPFGFDHSLTVGVVSALGRELDVPGGRKIHDVIQTDAAINPGNSGGPLLDSRGRVIGLTSAIFSPSGAFAGIGLAIPIDTIGRLVPQLISRGRAIQPGIGVTLLPDGWSARYRIEGVALRKVLPGGPAEQVGLEGARITRSGEVRLGDRIIAVDGRKVDSQDDLMHFFEDAGVGKTVSLTVAREGKTREVRVRLVALEP